MLAQYQLAKQLLVQEPAWFSPSALKYAIRLSIAHPKLMNQLNEFFNQNSFRKNLWNREEFKRDIYLQQMRACFYKNSKAQDRWYFLQSHFEMMEATHKPEILQLIYNSQLPSIVLHTGEHSLSIKLMYHHDLIREGYAWLLVEMDDQVIFKMTFWLMQEKNIPTLCVSALQGGKETLEANREFTKYFFGLRPQNMGMHALRWYAESLGIEQIYSFPIEKIWSKKIKDRVAVEEFLQEQGAVRIAATPYVKLDREETRKSMDDIPSKKRSMYRKRFEFLDETKAQCQIAFANYFSTKARSIT